MPSDYEAIRKHNLWQYGHATHHLEFLGRMYPDREHCLYELLQNAEDAGARRVRFRLTASTLELWHNGRPFDEDDVKGVCGVGEGTKAEDLTKIGKFGIGFKAVYAYTTHPEIHSGDEHFRIEAFVRPHPVAPLSLGKAWTTLQIFPFDRPDLAPSVAFDELRSGLRRLGARTLLFLRNVTCIEWEIDNVGTGAYTRETRSWGTARHITSISDHDSETTEERWLVFEQRVAAADVEQPVRVEVAWRLRVDEDGNESIEPIIDSTLVVFFPTDKSADLGFLIQGPYRTTPARDNVPARDTWNEKLIEQTAELLVTSLRELRRMGQLSVEALQTLPIRAASFPDGSQDRERSMLRPLFEAVRDALREEALLPAYDSSFVAAKHGKIARSGALRQLLDRDSLQQLYGDRPNLTWLSDEISPVPRMADLYLYLRNTLGVEEVAPEVFAARLDETYLRQRSDNWMAQFYLFLTGQEALWKPRGPLRRKPFVRLENGTHVSPFANDDRTPNAYLPPDNPTDFPVVKRCLLSDPSVRAFFTKLGLSEPDIGDEVIQKVLPKYDPPTGLPKGDEHLQDLHKVLRAIRNASPKNHATLLTAIRERFYLLANRGSTTGEERHVRPQWVYLADDRVQMYLAGNPDAFFLSSIYPESLHEQLIELGVQRSVRIYQRRADSSGYVVIAKDWGRHRRGLDGFDPDWGIDGLEYALNHITLERAIFIWNELLAGHAERVQGWVETATRQSYENADLEELRSVAGEMLMEYAWLPTRDGDFHLAADLTLDDLPPSFMRDELLAAALGMRANKVKLLADELGLDMKHLDLLLRHRNRFDDLIKQIEASEHESEEDESDELDTEPVDWSLEVAERFNQPGGPVEDDTVFEPGPAPNPGRREERLREAIREGVRDEPLQAQRFRRVPRKVWEAKNNVVRPFLREQYGGHCQVCGQTFRKQDGSPYFEGLYLVPTSKARWIDRPGNMLCLCATCCAKFEHGAVEAEDIIEQIVALRATAEDGVGDSRLYIRLAGEDVAVRFSERHMLELRAMVRATEE